MFRAYANNPCEDKDGEECSEREDGDPFSSFDQARILEARDRRESRAKEVRLAEKIKDQNVLRYLNSDSDDDEAQIHVVLPTPSHFNSVGKVELPIAKRKKKSKSHKRRRKRNHRERSSSSSSSSDSYRKTKKRGSAKAEQSDYGVSPSSSREFTHEYGKRRGNDFSVNKEKWSFLLPFEERSVEGSYIVLHKTFDHDNFHMDCIPKGHTAEYERRLCTILNGNERLDKEEIFESSRAHGKPIDRRPLVERQISILDQAISSNPRMVDYRLRRLHFLKEIRPASELLSEWEKILNTFVNNCSAWEKYLDFMQYDMAFYQNEIMDKAFDRCFSKLYAIINGTFKSHKAEENTDMFLLNIYVRRLMWWMECGFTNRAVASVQATIEYNFQRPESLNVASEQEKMQAFSEFWNSGVPRFGDLEAKGWANYYALSEKAINTCDFELVEREAQVQRISLLEEKIASSANDSVMCWVEMERELDIIESRPRRRLTEKYVKFLADESCYAQKEVSFEDIRILPHCGGNAIYILLRTLGAHFDKSLSFSLFYSNSQYLFCAPTFYLLEEWDLIPFTKALFAVPSVGAQSIALNMVYAMLKLQPSIQLVTCLLETKASQLDREFFNRPTGIRITNMRNFLRDIMSVLAKIDFGLPREDLELTVAAYALNMFGRWVRKESEERNKKVDDEEFHQPLKKKKKKDDREFTVPQYVEKLKEFIYKIGDSSLFSLEPVRLQVLLKTLLSLIQIVPRSSALDLITRFLLRKGDHVKLSPTDALAALEEWKQLFRTLDNYFKPLPCFESSRALCIALRIHFDYARASMHSHKWAEECENLFQSVEHCQIPDDRSVILSAYLDVLEHNWVR
ncbi:hypothetical protein DICVIV_05934 [Dictyocaulus viviparus]|uniref:Uncharacterized protein n=1 Tax=Dictyocaulus viviparus TaxID=29172 RepID=A0A0D8XTL1_DICVI|nr:hypothetical protein DICVIV_05934 [Dictyocaulus viviparus]